MVNINITIPDDLHKKAKVKCAIDEISIKDFVIKVLEEAMNG
ncbi:type II toxin-antitoxin system HicB family antitoxin [Candidatus Woesearchaeota archaeon]|nr:type II toxin-antitoxin system HicB family antitoxin [Candidatus Woesearchaeota archaeon]